MAISSRASATGCSNGRMGCASTRTTTSGPRTSRHTWPTGSIRPAGSRWCSAARTGPGEWHEFGHLRLFNEPNEAVPGPTGDLFVLQGHGKGKSLILKFDRDGNFIKTFGRKGKGPGEFDLPHSLVFDAKGLLYIADRNNARIQVLDADGNYIRESKHPGTPCGLFMGTDQHIWLAHGHTGQVMKLDLNGNVVGTMEGAGQGKTLGKYGEAHYIAVSPRGEIFVADTLNWRVQKYVKK